MKRGDNMGKCFIEIDGSPPELLYEDVRDGKGNFVEEVYHDKERVKSVWEQMADNIAQTVRGILIQQPELIPVFAKYIKANKEDFPDEIFQEENIERSV